MDIAKYGEHFNKIGYFHWDSLRKIQNNKIIRSSYIWLVIVPVTAKLLYKIESPLRVDIQGQIFSLDLSLPFSWRIFFFSALCFAIGNIIYSVFAPRIIKDFSGFGDFLSSGKTDEHLRSYLNDTLKKYADGAEGQRKIDLAEILAEKNTSRSDRDTRRTKKLFWFQYDYFVIAASPQRLVTGLLYALGFLLFAWVAIDNILWVFREL